MEKLFGVSVSELVKLSSNSSDQSELKKILAEKEKEIMQLQKKLIVLLEQKNNTS